MLHKKKLFPHQKNNYIFGLTLVPFFKKIIEKNESVIITWRQRVHKSHCSCTKFVNIKFCYKTVHNRKHLLEVNIPAWIKQKHRPLLKLEALSTYSVRLHKNYCWFNFPIHPG